MMAGATPGGATGPLDLIADQVALLEALAAFYRSHRAGEESPEAMRKALEAARTSAITRWSQTNPENAA